MKEECIINPILLVGNPNTGKTTLFNKITKSNEHIGNWHGVTVEEKKKKFKFENQFYTLIDLPGIYSLKSLSYEEKVAIEYIENHRECKIINICDINNLERNLYLTLCLIERGFDVFVAINTTLKKNICRINEKKLSQKLGVPIVIVNAQTGEGVSELLKRTKEKTKKGTIKKESKNIELFAEEKYKQIEDILKSCREKTGEVYGKSKIDKILLNRFFAPFVFFGIMALVFYLTFFLLGKPLSSFLSYVLENFIGQPLNNLFTKWFGANSWVTVLISEALVGGIGTLLSFLPQIVLLFLFLSILEDSGYLSRVAFIFDGLLSKIGLSGRSIYTLLLGFGCSASAILTARNMDDKKAKIKTVLITPFLSCSARLPIYLAIGGAFFGDNNLFVIFGLYILGLLVSVIISTLLNKTILKSDNQTFILEFPPYRAVSFKRIVKVLWDNVKSFVIRIGGLLISMNVIVWLLSNFSFNFEFIRLNGGESMLESIAKFIAPIFSPLGFGSWGIVVALLVGVVAKEGVVSTIMLFASSGLTNALFNPTSEIYFASSSAVLAFLTFCLLYVPCISTIAVMKKEIGGKWTIFAVLMQLFVAYFVAMIVYNFSELCYYFGFMKLLLISFIILIILVAISRFVMVFQKGKCKSCKDCHKR